MDEDGYPCEDIDSLRLFVLDSLQEASLSHEFDIRAVNFSTYGASFVYLGEDQKPVTPLYNYLKVYPEVLKKQFYETYGGETVFSFRTASPVLGSLNSGMQLYRIKYEKPELFKKIKYALHLPQYLSSLITGKYFSDITSIGCHTNLWDFQKNDYHAWVKQEGVFEKLAPIVSSNDVVQSSCRGNIYKVGIGLHDSSAALIPYLLAFVEPFVLISTGTWCISLNPFNHSPLTQQELENDGLCYISFEGNPVKASRLFTGYEHDEQVKRIAEHFHQKIEHYEGIEYDREIISKLTSSNSLIQNAPLSEKNLNDFHSDAEAYHSLMLDIVAQQYASTNMILQSHQTKKIFVDGGFSKNALYINLLATFFPDIEIYAASMAQASALGAALVIHRMWNTRTFPIGIIELQQYSHTFEEALCK
jgi:sugar (pentulose or hexulose) kinase